jgi:hypothetical protein
METNKDLIIANRTFLRHLVDIVWSHVKESEEVPSTKLADDLIEQSLNSQPESVVKEEKPKSKRQSFKICAGCGSFAHGNPGHDLIK